MVAHGAIQEVAVKGTAKTTHRPFNDSGSFKQSLAGVIFQRQIRGQPVGQSQRVSLQLPHLKTQNCGFFFLQSVFLCTFCLYFAQSVLSQSIIRTARPDCFKPETRQVAAKLHSSTLSRSEKHCGNSIKGNAWGSVLQCCTLCVDTC